MTARKISLSDFRSKDWDDVKEFNRVVDDRHVAIYVAALPLLNDPTSSVEDIRGYCAHHIQNLRRRVFVSPAERAFKDRMALLWEEFSSMIED